VSPWLIVLGATAVAVALRAPFVASQGLGYEEVFTASIAGHASIAGVWSAVKATESTPPLFYVLSWLSVKVFAAGSPAALRAVSLLAGCALVPVAFLGLRRVLGVRVALAAAWICAINPWLVGFSIYARSYALLALVSALSVWALAAVIERPSRARLAFWVLSAAACLWTHYFGIFVVLAEASVLLVVLGQRRRQILVACAAVGVAFVPLLPLFTSQSGSSERTQYIGAQPLGGRLGSVIRQFAMGTNVPSKWLEGAGILLVVGAVLCALVAGRSRREVRLLAAVALIGAGIPILSALSGIRDDLLARNLLGVWICVAALAAIGLSRLRSLPLALYSALCLATVLIVQTDWRYQPADWRGAGEKLVAESRGQPIAVLPGIYVNVAALDMHRAPLNATLTSTSLWAMVAPERGPHQRALNAISSPPLAQLFGGAWRTVAEVDYHGFRLIHLQAPAPVAISPAPSNNGPASAPDALLLAP